MHVDVEEKDGFEIRTDVFVLGESRVVPGPTIIDRWLGDILHPEKISLPGLVPGEGVHERVFPQKKG